MSVAATMMSMHVCPMFTAIIPHVGIIVIGPPVPTVILGIMPAVTVGATAICVGPPDSIMKPASPTISVGGKPPIALGASATHGGAVVSSMCMTVMYG